MRKHCDRRKVALRSRGTAAFYIQGPPERALALRTGPTRFPAMQIKRAFLATLAFACLLSIAHAAERRPTNAIEVPFTKYVLSNGLTLIVHEDHKAPIVAVNVWYHVGSKNEKPGKTGFAHLFEHLMFNGSENFVEILA